MCKLPPSVPLLCALLALASCEHHDQSAAAEPKAAPAQPDVAARSLTSPQADEETPGATRDATGVTNAQAPNFDRRTLDRLADARCDREVRCNNVGIGLQYATRGVCSQMAHGSLANDLNEYGCPRGLDASAVGRCLAAIRNQTCNQPLESISRLGPCGSGAMCIK